MASRRPMLLVGVLALGLTLAACASGGVSIGAPASSSSLPSPTPIAAVPSMRAVASPTAVPAPTYPANVEDLADFSPLEVETYYVEPFDTDIQVFYTIPAKGWFSWVGAFKPGGEIDPPNSVVGLSILNVINVVQDGCTGHLAADPPVGPTVEDMATALSRLKPFVLSIPPSDVTIDGFRGKHLELTVPHLELGGTADEPTFADCTDGQLWSYIGPPLSFANHAYRHPGQAEQIYRPHPDDPCPAG